MNTQDILEQIKKTSNLEDLLDDHKKLFNASKFSNKFNTLLQEKSMPVSYIINNTQLSKSYVYKLLAGERALSKDSLLQISLSLKCTLDETNELIKYAGVPALYAKSERDCIIIYAIMNNLSLHDTDQLLYKQSFKPLQSSY
jgi:hypothetical protein